MEKKDMKEAIEKAKNTKRNFTQSVDLSITLKDLDFKQPESRVRSEVALPHGRGKPVRIGVFAEGDMAQRAKKMGLDVYSQEDIEKLGEDKRKAKKIAEEHEFFFAQADLMPTIGRTLGPVLGRRNKMPTPVAPMAPLEPLVEKFTKTVAIDSKNRPVIHCSIGTEKMSNEDLVENAMAVINTVERQLPRRENNIDTVYLKTTMGNPVKVV
ncbi:MAG: 50S ribosomal protein L1 [Candidatus Methanofastidiosia archaeon]|jgi:large subunit ribosomal protein L1